MIDLENLAAQPASWRFIGIDPYDTAGVSVASAGDVDGDGRDDLIIGARGADGGGSNSGEAYLLLAADLAAADARDGTVDGQIDLAHVSPPVTLGSDAGEELIGSATSDTLSGRGGNDSLTGLAGPDLLDGGPGDDRLDGGADDDLYLFWFGTGGSDRITETGGTDTLMPRSTLRTLSFVRDGTDLRIDKTGAPGRVAITDFFGAAGARVEFLALLDTTVLLKTNLTGTSANEVLIGTDADESIAAGDGRDAVFAGGGNDTLVGGAGRDDLHGGTGNDRYEIAFGGGAEAFVTERDGDGTDTVAIPDRTLAELDFRRSGTELVIEQEGGGGDDRITAGSGMDRLSGGAGADVFIYAAVADSTTQADARDTIDDFSQVEGDRIGLSGIDADTGTAGNQAFTFLGAGATAGAGTLAFTFVGGNTLIEADVDGGGKRCLRRTRVQLDGVKFHGRSSSILLAE